MRTCSIEGCQKKYFSRGFCGMHYQRNRNHGSPMIVQREVTPSNILAEWILGHVGYDDERCLIWPYGKDPRGYGKMTVASKQYGTHVIMATIVHGAPPSPRHHVCHSCGNGHLACVAPNHLRWGTPAENSADMVRQGRSARGSRQWLAKLTEMQVIEIREKILVGELQTRIADEYGVDKATIRDIKNGSTWAWL